MLRKKKPAAKKGGLIPAATNHQLNSLVKDTQVEGTIHSESDIRIDGTLKGELHCKSKVIIGPTGFVSGEVHCRNAVVEGRFEGTLQVKEVLNVRETADVSGEVTTNKLIVQSGAVFNVSCSMGSGAAERPRSAQSKPLSKGKASGSQKEDLQKEAG